MLAKTGPCFIVKSIMKDTVSKLLLQEVHKIKVAKNIVIPLSCATMANGIVIVSIR